MTSPLIDDLDFSSYPAKYIGNNPAFSLKLQQLNSTLLEAAREITVWTVIPQKGPKLIAPIANRHQAEPPPTSKTAKFEIINIALFAEKGQSKHVISLTHLTSLT